MIRRLPFDFSRHFVADMSSSDCLGACLAMCARYWNDFVTNFQLSPDLAFWNRYLERLNSTTPKGNSVLRLLSVLRHLADDKGVSESEPTEADQENEEEDYVGEVIEGKTVPPMVIQGLTLASIEETREFLRKEPPITVILCYDHSLAHTLQEAGGHAVLLHSYDIQKEQVHVIDPGKPRFTEPFPLNLRLFNTGWKALDNLAFAVYPRSAGISLYSTEMKKDSATLDKYLGDRL